MKPRALAIANNDLVYLWWTYPAKVDDSLGFTVRRHQDGKPPQALPAFVGFDPKHAGDPEPPAAQRTTDFWPIQSYQWKDLTVPEETEVFYEIVPVTGTPGEKLEDIAGQAVQTNRIKASDRVGSHRVVFNRGIISTQSVAAALPKGPDGRPSAPALTEHIGTPGDAIRTRLAGEAPAALTSLLRRAREDGGTCHCALYELTDPELVAALKAAKGHVQVILSNADKTEKQTGKDVKVYDGTNHDTRVDLQAFLGDAFHDRLLPKGNFIGHNKFVVYVDPGGAAKGVVTGSTNWTPTGLCAQSNNVLVLHDEAVAARYLAYWNELLADDAKQAPALRHDDAQPPPDLALGAVAQGSARIWFSPNTVQKTKPKTNPAAPPDMAELFQAIGEAEHGVLFLLFSAGAPSILDRLTEVEKDRAAAQKEFFVRGAISDARTSTKFATHVYNDSLLDAPNTLITGIAGVDDPFSFWEEELAKLGYAVIHDKIVVIDPFTDRCLVATGSHNLGYKASYSNDENLCLIRGNKAIAQAYTSHVLDIVNHYNWRYNLPPGNKKAVTTAGAKPRFDHLAKTAGWQDKYFKGNFLASRDRFFFGA